VFCHTSKTETISQSSEPVKQNLAEMQFEIHKHQCNVEPMKLTTYISTMLQQDLHNLILVLGGSQVQRCPHKIDWLHINTLG
jgi:hypothetical protein